MNYVTVFLLIVIPNISKIIINFNSQKGRENSFYQWACVKSTEIILKCIQLCQNLRQLKEYKQMISEQLVRQAAGEEENTKVYKVDLNNKAIKSINGFKPFSKLRCLQLNFNRIRCIENLECLPDLRQLHLEYNEIDRIQGLEANKMLTVLCLNANRIQKIQNISHLGRLETFNINQNLIDKITGLQSLKDLKYLSLNKNKLTSIDSLPSFSKLDTLEAENNKISRISPNIFTKCNKLAKLNLSHNQLKELSALNNLNSLEWLNVDDNKIEDLKITHLKNLQYFNISNNFIESLPKVKQTFPELGVFLFANNQIMSEYIILESVSEAEMMVEIDFRGNPMETSDFQQTLFRLYKFDRINGVSFSKPGSRYISLAEDIVKDMKTGELGMIQDDEDSRRIKMSGFYNQKLETQMSGTKPDRPLSGRKKQININYEEIEKSYNDVLQNNKKIQNLRLQCQNIFKQNGITLDIPVFSQPQEQEPVESSRQTTTVFPTEFKKGQEKASPGNTTISELENRNEENKNKWNELKNKDKTFNIRGVVRKVSGSSRKSQVKEGSGSQLSGINFQKPDLMRTQQNPPRWNNEPNLMKTLQHRAMSAKKNSNK